MAGHDSGRGSLNKSVWRWHGPIRSRFHPEHTRQPALDSDVIAFDLLNRVCLLSWARIGGCVLARLIFSRVPAVQPPRSKRTLVTPFPNSWRTGVFCLTENIPAVYYPLGNSAPSDFVTPASKAGVFSFSGRPISPKLSGKRNLQSG